VYQEVDRAFSEGDRMQFTAPSRHLRIANRELGTIQKINDAGDLEIRMDSGRDIAFNIREHPHLDHGYAVTSHSSQGQTADRVLVHVDTEKSEQWNDRIRAGVAVSCRNHCKVYFEFAGPRPVRIFKDFDSAASRTPLNPRYWA
jgi:hypothetical protein